VGAFLLVAASLPAKEHKPFSAHYRNGCANVGRLRTSLSKTWTLADVALNIGINITKTPPQHQTQSQLFAA
jgi:hypothetical protein